MVALFLDLKTAFDSVNRNVLLEVMRVQGVRDGLVDRVEQVVKETKIRVRIGVGGKFLDGKKSEAGMSVKPDSVSYPVGGLGEADRKS